MTAKIENQCGSGCTGGGEWNHSCTSEFVPVTVNGVSYLISGSGVTGPGEDDDRNPIPVTAGTLSI